MTQNDNAQDPGEQFERDFLKAAALSLAIYQVHGSRSTKKLFPVHGCIAGFVSRSLGAEYKVKSLGVGDNKEATISGAYYNKVVDIAVLKGEKPLAITSFKFVASNYQQNHINYFEHMLGETANLRRSGCGFAHVLVLRKMTPYLSRGGKAKKVEVLPEHNLIKYVRLFQDQDYPHRPDLLAIAIVDDDKELARLCEADSGLGFSTETVALLQGDLSLRNFARKFPHLCKLKE